MFNFKKSEWFKRNKYTGEELRRLRAERGVGQVRNINWDIWKKVQKKKKKSVKLTKYGV